jgi:hypothetical protein
LRRLERRNRAPGAYEGYRIAREHHGAGTETERFVGMGKTFQQPHTEKAGSARDEKCLTSRLAPQFARVCKHMVEVFRG